MHCMSENVKIEVDMQEIGEDRFAGAFGPEIHKEYTRMWPQLEWNGDFVVTMGPLQDMALC